jgi:hypothetical protein
MTNEAWSGPNRLRTSDTEREEIAAILRAAMSEGRLTLDEGEERLTAAYAAKYRDELGPLTADLPDGGRRALLDTPEARASREATRRGVRRHAGAVIAVAMVLTALWVLSGAHFFFPLIPLVFLFIGLRRHARWEEWQQRSGNPHGVAPWNAPHHDRPW